MPADGTIYVYGHTDYESTIFAVTAEHQALKMNAEELAEHLADKDKGALAYDVWKALDGKGYKKLTVFGYTQTVLDYTDPKSHKPALELKDPENPDLKTAADKGRASQNRIRIAPGGTVTVG